MCTEVVRFGEILEAGRGRVTDVLCGNRPVVIQHDLNVVVIFRFLVFGG